MGLVIFIITLYVGLIFTAAQQASVKQKTTAVVDPSVTRHTADILFRHLRTITTPVNGSNNGIPTGKPPGPSTAGSDINRTITAGSDVIRFVDEFNNAFRYQVSLSGREQWRILNGSSTPFIPKKKKWATDAQSTITLKHLDLMQLPDMAFMPKYKNPCYHDKEKLLRCLPYFYLIGSPKCGTTDLFRRISVHPEYVGNSKEPHWLTRTRMGAHESEARFTSYTNKFHAFTKQMNNQVFPAILKRHLITGDGSASTLWDNDHWTALPGNDHPLEPVYTNADYVYKINPGAKIVFILRNPIARLYSDYLYFEEQHLNKSPADFHRRVIGAISLFSDCLTQISLRSCVYNRELQNQTEVRLRIGIYYIYLLEWYRVFPKAQILPLRLETHARHMSASLARVFDFLGLRDVNRVESSRAVRHRRFNSRSLEDVSVGPMWPETKLVLHTFYKHFNRKLARLLNDTTFDY